MWVMVWRPLLVLAGLGGFGESGMVWLVVSKNQIASDTVTYFGWMLVAAQAALSIGLIAVGIWEPLRRWTIGLARGPRA